jgi:hypothetical protein
MTSIPTHSRALLHIEYVDPGPYACAHAHAQHKVGVPVADLITWKLDEDLTAVGTISFTDQTLTFRFEQSEPGNERLEVLVACPGHPDCRNRWDLVEDLTDLKNYLEHGEASGDPICDEHDD